MVKREEVEDLDATEEEGEARELVANVDHERPVLGIYEEGCHMDANSDDVNGCRTTNATYS